MARDDAFGKAEATGKEFLSERSAALNQDRKGISLLFNPQIEGIADLSDFLLLRYRREQNLQRLECSGM